MTFLAGIVRQGPSDDLSRLCAAMVAAAPIGGAPAIHAQDGSAFGRLPLPTFGKQSDCGPVMSPSGRYLLTGDIRVDNASELARQMGLTAREPLADHVLLAQLWDRVGAQACRMAVGDLALAVFDFRDCRLTLVRSVSAVRSLLYVRRPGLLAFASLLQSLRVLDGSLLQLDVPSLASNLAGDPYADGRTAFADVRLLRPGTMVHLSEQGSWTEDLWSDLLNVTPALSLEDSAAGIRQAMELAVAARLERTEGGVATQLSAGRDSSAVTGLAALISARRGERIVAVTGAPAIGSEELGPGGRLNDESAIASITAAHFGNVEHIIARTSNSSPLAEQLDEAHRWFFGPALNAGSLDWWNAVLIAAQAAGATVLLTGTGGNNTISSGGGHYLYNVFSSQGVLATLRQIARLSRGSPATRRNLLRLGVGALLPPALYLRLQSWRGDSSPGDWLLFREPLRSLLRDCERASALDWAPRRDGSELRLDFLRFTEPSDPVVRNGAVMDVRDPTLDRRVLEACFRVPPQWLLSRVDERPVYRAAFGDILPEATLNNRIRGYQGADWYRFFSRQAVQSAFARYRQNAAVQDLIDLGAVDDLVENWPLQGWGRDDVIALYRYQLGLALSVASFLHCHVN